MGFDNDCILNIQSLAGEYFCPVCHLLVYPNEALQAPCTHLYCKPCLTYVVSTTHACPYDGYRVVEADSKPLLESNKALADTIGKIQVHCLYYRTGCTWQGPLFDCNSHCASCAFGESPVQCNRCGIQIVHRQVQEHAQICPGLQSESQQPGAGSNATSTGLGPDQEQTAGQTTAPAQSQAMQASASSVSTQDTNQQASSAMQPQAAQAGLPTPDQWYQHQQQYQQYHQQYPAYDPCQRQHQYYYQYPQAIQAYQQPSIQTYTSQSSVQAPPQAYGQVQPQAQLQAQQQGQSHAQPHPQPQAQAPSHTLQTQAQQLTQPGMNTQALVQPAGQAQLQVQAPIQGPSSNLVPYIQSQLPQAQQQPVAQQMPVPQYQQAHPHMQHSYAQPYPQSQMQQYSHPPSQAQTHSQPTSQAAAPLPSQVNQPVIPSAQLQVQNAVTGYQSYPQAHLHPQAQVGAVHQMLSTGSQQPGQLQGRFSLQASHIRPLQPYAAVPNQQQPAMLSAQVQAPTGTLAHPLSVYPQVQQVGHPYQQRAGAAQQALPQELSFPGQVPFMQAQLNPQLQPPQLPQPQQNYASTHGAQLNVTQSYPVRQMILQSVGSQPYAQAAGAGDPGHGRLTQSQTYPMRTNSQLSGTSEQEAVHVPTSLKTSSGESFRDQSFEKGDQNQNGHNEERRAIAGASDAGGQVDEMIKVKSEDGIEETADGNDTKRDMPFSASELQGSKQVPGTQPKTVEVGVVSSKPGMSEIIAGGISEPSSGAGTTSDVAKDNKELQKAKGQGSKHIDRGTVSISMLPQPHLVPQGHVSSSFSSTNQGRNQMQPIHFVPSAQQRPEIPSIRTSMADTVNPQQSAPRVHPPNQLRPQGPGEVPPRPPFNAFDNSQLPIQKHLPGAVHHENQRGGILGPGSTGFIGRPGNIGHSKGHLFLYQPGQPQNPQGEPFVGPSLAAQRPVAFDSHGSMVGREPLNHSDVVQQHHAYPPDSEKFPVQRPDYFDNRLPPYPHPHAPLEQRPYGPAPLSVQPGAVKFSGSSAHDVIRVPGTNTESGPFPEDRLKPFPHRESEDDFRKFPGPSHLEAGPSKFGSQFPASRPVGKVPLQYGVDALPRHFEKGPHELDSDPGVSSVAARLLPLLHPNDVGERLRPLGFPDGVGRPDFGHHPRPAPGHGFIQHRKDGLPLRSPGRDYSSFPSRTFGVYRDIGGNESQSFEGSKTYGFSREPFGKLSQESRFQIPPNHLRRDELEVLGNMHMGDPFFGVPHHQNMPPGHLRRGERISLNLHLGEGTTCSRSAGPSRIGEPPLAGSFPQHRSFGESFRGEKPGHQAGYRGSYSFERYVRDGGFYQGGMMESFDNWRKRKPGSIMCRICKVECGTVEGLDLHSQSREHQRKAMDMVRSIKLQNKKKK